jgi:hypothetical protein
MLKKNKLIKLRGELINLVNSPAQISWLVFALSLGFLNFAITWDKDYNVFNSFQTARNIPVVKGESIRGPLADLEKLTADYQNQLKNILQKYLLEHDSAPDLIDYNAQTIDQILTLRAPGQYQKLHLELVALLTEENNQLGSSDSNRSNIISNSVVRLEDVLHTNSWLNL